MTHRPIMVRVSKGATMEVNVGKGISLEIDVTKLPANVMAHVVYMGLRNILMDSHAGATVKEYGDKADEMARDIVVKKLERMYAGEVRMAREAKASVDPITAEAMRMARGAVNRVFTVKYDGDTPTEWTCRDKATFNEWKVSHGDGFDLDKVAGVAEFHEYIVEGAAPGFREAAEKVVAAKAGIKGKALQLKF